MDDSEELSGRWSAQRYSVAQLLLGTGIVLWGVFRLGPTVWIAGLIIGAGGLAKLLARRLGVLKRTFTVLNVGPLFLLGCYFAVVAAVAGSWGLSILAVTVSGMAAALLLPSHGEIVHLSIAVIGFGSGTLYYAMAGDLIVAAVALFFVGLNARSLWEHRRGTAQDTS